MVNYSKFEAIVQAEVEESHETTQHLLTLLDLMILLPPREELPVPSSRASTTRHPPIGLAFIYQVPNGNRCKRFHQVPQNAFRGF